MSKKSPGRWFDVRFQIPELSVVVGGVHVTVPVGLPSSVSPVWSLGQL